MEKVMSEQLLNKAAIEANTRETVRNVALRKVRTLVDQLQAEDVLQGRLQIPLLLFGVAGVIVMVAFLVAQKNAQQMEDRRRESIYACEDGQFKARAAELEPTYVSKDQLANPRDPRAVLTERQMQIYVEIRTACEAQNPRP
jgi:hypothetical protein